MRADTTDKFSWKRFLSANAGSPSNTPVPNIWLNLTDQGAAYSLPFPMTPPTSTTTGSLTVRVQNLGSGTWTPTNGYKLTYSLLTESGQLIRTGAKFAVPSNTAPGQSVDVPMVIDPITSAGRYRLRIEMTEPSGGGFNVAFGVPWLDGLLDMPSSLLYPAIPYPPANSQVDSLTPMVWADINTATRVGVDLRYQFKMCNGTLAKLGTCEETTAWQSAAFWQPSNALLSWGKAAFWQYKVSENGATPTSWEEARAITPVVGQPPVTSRLAGAAEGSEVPGVNPSQGNFATAATDAKVSVVGPPLSVTRTYNSQDPRTDGAFGTGWTTPLDQRVVPDADSSGNVVVTLATGLQVRFGKNYNGSYTAPEGMNLTLVRTTSPATWILRDRTGTKRTFNDAGKLIQVLDADAREQAYTYNGAGDLSTVTDVASGRALRLTWANRHVTSVATDPPAAGQAALTWTYTYSGDTLTSVCTPLGASSCSSYTYTSSSQYRAMVLDTTPVGYWPLGETSGSIAYNEAAGSKTSREAASYNFTPATVAGALTGSSDKATVFGTSASAAVALPTNLTNSSQAFATELWFKATSGQAGTLLGEQNTDISGAATTWNPLLYVGTDGKLHGMAPVTQSTSRIIGMGKCADIRIVRRSTVRPSRCGTAARGPRSNGRGIPTARCDPWGNVWTFVGGARQRQRRAAI